MNFCDLQFPFWLFVLIGWGFKKDTLKKNNIKNLFVCVFVKFSQARKTFQGELTLIPLLGYGLAYFLKLLKPESSKSCKINKNMRFIIKIVNKINTLIKT